MLKQIVAVTVVVGVVALTLIPHAWWLVHAYSMVLDLCPDYLTNYYYGDVKTHPGNVKKSGSVNNVKLFTKEELKSYTGAGGSRVYLGLLGQVFDVTKGRKHYGEDGGYSFFSGKDGTRAFVSGQFTDEGLVEDITGLSHDDIRGLEDWLSFYNKDYKFIGKLIGHFYDERGEPTDGHREYETMLAEARKDKDKKDEILRQFPPCNSETVTGKSARVWCTTLSGGIQRDWVGVPRQYYKPGSTQFRCACVKDTGAPTGARSGSKHNNNGDLDNPQMKLYSGCEPSSFSCALPVK